MYDSETNSGHTGFEPGRFAGDKTTPFDERTGHELRLAEQMLADNPVYAKLTEQRGEAMMSTGREAFRDLDRQVCEMESTALKALDLQEALEFGLSIPVAPVFT